MKKWIPIYGLKYYDYSVDLMLFTTYHFLMGVLGVYLVIAGIVLITKAGTGC